VLIKDSFKNLQRVRVYSVKWSLDQGQSTGRKQIWCIFTKHLVKLWWNDDCPPEVLKVAPSLEKSNTLSVVGLSGHIDAPEWAYRL